MRPIALIVALVALPALAQPPVPEPAPDRAAEPAIDPALTPAPAPAPAPATSFVDDPAFWILSIGAAIAIGAAIGAAVHAATEPAPYAGTLGIRFDVP